MTVSSLQLDRFEVTVGRFRKFVEAYPDSKPAEGAGRHRKIEGSGWDTAWDSELPPDALALKNAITCSEYKTWTDEPGDYERLPMNCLNWYVAFAFCAWDGGRLPTEAEWYYAEVGGSEQRRNPWSQPGSQPTLDGTFAIYACTGDVSGSDDCTFGDITPVGSRSPKGDGKWGQADLAGSMWEWTLDRYKLGRAEGNCEDCANLIGTSGRVKRGWGWSSGHTGVLEASHNKEDPAVRLNDIGVRCARTP
ncbi:formylglycine-generating enzyme family protein [Sorangium sp. KYC3313]|uniref:formylglycine-generating enzyme family protein n=1 Tax=Sorangium sp. KYC3313 TaxID=3449740 RepID=UPI003F8A70DB